MSHVLIVFLAPSLSSKTLVPAVNSYKWHTIELQKWKKPFIQILPAQARSNWILPARAVQFKARAARYRPTCRERASNVQKKIKKCKKHKKYKKLNFKFGRRSSLQYLLCFTCDIMKILIILVFQNRFKWIIGLTRAIAASKLEVQFFCTFCALHFFILFFYFAHL